MSVGFSFLFLSNKTSNNAINGIAIPIKSINKEKYKEVAKILQYHTDIRHIRGGEATKMKFLLKKSN